MKLLQPLELTAAWIVWVTTLPIPHLFWCLLVTCIHRSCCPKQCLNCWGIGGLNPPTVFLTP